METTNIKELIEQRAKEYAEREWSLALSVIPAHNGYLNGAKMILKEYQGITPETVKLLLEALKGINRAHNNVWSIDEFIFIKNQVEEAINQANKELNNL